MNQIPSRNPEAPAGTFGKKTEKLNDLMLSEYPSI